MSKTIEGTAVVVRDDYALSPQAEAERARYQPVMNVTMALERRDTVLRVIRDMMTDGQDYGAIPGAGQKKCLLQPGAQKLDNIFGLVPTYQIVDKDLDWTGENHGGEPFFHYEVRCILMRGEFQMGEGLGQCSSWESKYRWRKGERKCPACGAECIIKGKAEYGGGWICFAKKGGCGAKFKSGDASIESQETGRKPNPDIHDQVNTILKMAEKRAHLLSTINATSASEFLTQDVVDEPAPEDVRQGTQGDQAEVAERRIAEERQKASQQTAARAATTVPLDIGAVCKQFSGIKEKLPADFYYDVLKKHGVAHSNEFRDRSKAVACYKDLVKELAAWNKISAGNAPLEAVKTTEAGADVPQEMWPVEAEPEGAV